MSDMKKTIAEACLKLLADSKKLTVTDIVESCNITRQTFYYHFEDIPDLFRWILERGKDELKKRIDLSDKETAIKYLLLMGYQVRPYIEGGLKTNYRDEIVKIFDEHVYSLFQDAIKNRKLYIDKSVFEIDVIVRYHASALIGLIKSLDEDDIKYIDKIANIIYKELT